MEVSTVNDDNTDHDEDETPVECCSCGQVILDTEEPYTHDGDTYCETCFQDELSMCSSCNEYVGNDDLRVVDPGTRVEDYVCEDCLDNYYQCSDCGSYFSEAYIYMRDDSDCYCHNCSDNYCTCEGCDQVISCDDVNYTSDDRGPYCDRCYSEEEDDGATIHDYSYKPCWQVHGDTKCNTVPTLGVENEVDKARNITDTAEEILNHSDSEDLYFLKYDSSLDNGFEIVSHPCTLAYHTEHMPWKTILDIAINDGMRSHNTSTCGLHVHVNRGYFGDTESLQDLQIAKLLILTDKLWNQLVILSRREYSALEHYAKKLDLGILPADTESTIISKAKNTTNRGRYQAWNLENYATVEYRMPRGTLNHDTFLATLQLVQVMCEYAKEHTLYDIQNVTWESFRIPCTDYPQLAEYLVKKGI